MTHYFKRKLLIQIFIVFLWMLVTNNSIAGGDLGAVLSQYKNSSLVFYAGLQGLAISLLIKLWMIEMCWASIKWVLERKPFEDLVSHFISASFPPLFFLLVIKKGADWFTLILETFAFFGSKGAGFNSDSASMDPGVILEKGIILQNQMVAQFNDITGTGAISALQNLLPSLLLFFISIIMIVTFALMAANAFLIWAEAYLLIGVSPVLLSFAGMRWTRDIAPKTFNSMIACGIKILVLMLLMSIISKLVPIWATEIAAFKINDWSPYWRVAGSAAGCAYLAWKAPQIAANAISGTSSLTAGDALQIATMAATAAVATTALASGAADKVLGGASNAARGGFDSLRNSLGSSSIKPTSGSNSIPNPTGPDLSSSDGSAVSLSNGISSGNAKNASISSEAEDKIKKRFSEQANNYPQKKTSEKIQDGLRTFQSVIPNDQATVGGDGVKLKE